MSSASHAGRLQGWIGRLIDESAREWRVSKVMARIHFWLPLVVSVVVLASKVYQPAYHFLIQEDGLVEWATFFFAFVAACCSGWITFGRWIDGHRGQAVLFGLFTLALVFLAGEEISWGQRIIGFQTPEGLQGVNDKGEANLHNIGRFLFWTRFLTLAAGLLGTSAWVANRRIRIERYIDDAGSYFVPPFFLSTSFFVVMLFSISKFTILPLTATQSTRFAEVSEWCLAYGCCGFSWLVATRMRLASRQVAGEMLSGRTADGTNPASSIGPTEGQDGNAARISRTGSG